MRLVLERRAEIALRSLSPTEQKQLSRAMDEIRATDPQEFYRSPKVHRFIAASGDALYSYKGNRGLRLILSVNADTCTVEEVAHHDRIMPLLKQPRPQ